MAYETGSATNLADLMTKLDTFAVANGWTSDQLNTGTGQSALHRNNVYVSFRWNTTTPLVLGVYQALGYTGGNQPGQHPNDSGSGAVSSTNTVIDDERCVNDIGNGPFPSYYFFEYDFYIHVVVEIATDVFRHFGMGTIVKTGDWTGGEYAYGQFHASSNPAATGDTALLDGLFADTSGTNRDRNATIHMEGLPGMAGASKWGGIWGSSSAPLNDTAGNAKANVQGGFRGGPIARNFGWLSADSSAGLIPMHPITLYYRNSTDVYFLGYMPDVRAINVRYLVPKQEITIGSDVWVVFPSSQKTTTNITNRSYNQGIAYKKVTI